MADSGTSGTQVTLFVPQSSTTPPVPHARPNIPFTGFDLATALVLAALLLAVGIVLLTLGRQPNSHPSRRT